MDGQSVPIGPTPQSRSTLDGRTMPGWGFATYVIVAMVVLIIVMIVLGFARARTAKRSRVHRRAPSSSVDPFYLDSSHAGEPRTQDGSGR